MEAKKNILVVINPISGGIDKSEMREQLVKSIEELQLHFSVFETGGENDLALLKKKLEKENFARVIVLGGDGTLKLAAEAVIGKTIAVGLIPAGSANGMAKNLLIPPSLQEQIEVALSENKYDIDVLDINGLLALHISDFGLNAELIQNYEEGGIRGKLGYALQSIPTLISSKAPFDFEIVTSEGNRKVQAVLLAIANAKKYGTGATINVKGNMADGLFEILIFKNLNFFQILKTIQEEPDLSADFVEIIQTSRATVKAPKAIPFQIDGEFQGETKAIHITIKPQALTLLVPSEYLNNKENVI